LLSCADVQGNADNCPDINSPDYDFAQAPMLVTACKACKCKQLVVAGQKSGWLVRHPSCSCNTSISVHKPWQISQHAGAQLRKTKAAGLN